MIDLNKVPQFNKPEVPKGVATPQAQPDAPPQYAQPQQDAGKETLYQPEYKLPQWMQGKQWSDWGHAGTPIDVANVKQDWYRQPNWGGASG